MKFTYNEKLVISSAWTSLSGNSINIRRDGESMISYTIKKNILSEELLSKIKSGAVVWFEDEDMEWILSDHFIRMNNIRFAE